MQKKKFSKKKRVAVLMGGPSSEHEVSVRSGKNVMRHLDREKYEAREVLIDKEGKWSEAPERLKESADVAFVALHGTYGEDGTVQRILEDAGIPYTGSNALTSAFAMNKFLTLQYFLYHHLATPTSLLVGLSEWRQDPFRIIERARHLLGYPIVVKPNNNGSSVGVSIAVTKEELVSALEQAFSFSREALLQNFVRGREVTCAVIDHGWQESAFPLLPTEIIPRVSPFFDYRAKYEPEGSLEITPARFPSPMIVAIQRVAQRAHQLIGASGFSRTDMMVGEDGTIYTLEINTIPGLTEQSLLPKAAEASGISFGTLLEYIIEGALRGK